MYIDEMPRMEKKEEPIQARIVERRQEEERFEEKKLPKMKAIVSKGGKKSMIVLKINLGKDDGVGRVQITELIKYQANLEDEDVGTVGLGSSASYVEVSFDHVEYVIDSLNGYKTNEKKIFIQVAPKKAPYPGKEKGAVRSSEKKVPCVTAE
jgi:DbpA RNA binding domain.